MHLSPAQFEQYKLHADADRTAKMHSAVGHWLQVSDAQQPCSAKSAEAWHEPTRVCPGTEGISWDAIALCMHVCAAVCNALTRLHDCVCIQAAEVMFLASTLHAAATWTTLGSLEGRISALPCCTLRHPAVPCGPAAASSQPCCIRLHHCCILCTTAASCRDHCKQLPDAGRMTPCRWQSGRPSGSLIIWKTKQDPCKGWYYLAGGSSSTCGDWRF